MSAVDDLLNEIFTNRNPALAAEFEAWLRGSRRFRNFATEYRAKIRAKLRNVGGDESMQDLRAELETAAILLNEKRFNLEYEKLAASKQRSPDFTVTFKTHTPFNVEVRRFREMTNEDGARISKLMHVICEKVGQMPPSVINVLWLHADEMLPENDLLEATSKLRQLAETQEQEFFTHRGFKNTADFLKQYRKLSGIVLFQANEPMVWCNPLARHAIPSQLVNVLQRLESS